jgi:type II secretory pathway component PulJ
MPSRVNSGSALIEVLVALALLAVGGVALITLLGQTSRTMRATRDSERETIAASRVLDRFAAMDRATLLASIGTSGVAALRATVVEAAPGLFDVSVARSDTSFVLLRTTFYRPDSSRDVAP